MFVGDASFSDVLVALKVRTRPFNRAGERSSVRAEETTLLGEVLRHRAGGVRFVAEACSLKTAPLRAHRAALSRSDEVSCLLDAPFSLEAASLKDKNAGMKLIAASTSFKDAAMKQKTVRIDEKASPAKQTT